MNAFWPLIAEDIGDEKKDRKKKYARTPQIVKPPDRASNPTIPWMHGLAAMGDERWEEAIVALKRFLEMADNPPDRRRAHQNLLGMCRRIS